MSNWYQFMPQGAKRYMWSSLVTFLAAFSLVIYTQIDNITLTSFSDGTVVGIIFVALRAAVKAVIEQFLAWQGLR